ncbi:hypothetical protein FQA39_LY03962 [Lamprigera yunnana]|nr:hypothetical protein FQA39_LY03962 [Lamprigera yunnana]
MLGGDNGKICVREAAFAGGYSMEFVGIESRINRCVVVVDKGIVSVERDQSVQYSGRDGEIFMIKEDDLTFPSIRADFSKVVLESEVLEVGVYGTGTGFTVEIGPSEADVGKQESSEEGFSVKKVILVGAGIGCVVEFKVMDCRKSLLALYRIDRVCAVAVVADRTSGSMSKWCTGGERGKVHKDSVVPTCVFLLSIENQLWKCMGLLVG